jgi:aspartate/methionine/tyrosine aminotransferase
LSTVGLAADSTSFCTRLLDEAGIAATTGYDFDAARGENFFRLSYCAPTADVQEALTRLKRLNAAS